MSFFRELVFCSSEKTDECGCNEEKKDRTSCKDFFQCGEGTGGTEEWMMGLLVVVEEWCGFCGRDRGGGGG
jgi:hypothetical protein